MEYVADHAVLRKLISALLAPVEWLSPRMKAAGLIGLYTHSRNRAEAIGYLEKVVELSCRPRRQLKDELLVFTAFSELLKNHLDAKNYVAAIQNGVKAATLLLQAEEYGWKFFEDIGDSKLSMMIDLRNAIRTHERDIKIVAADVDRLDELIQKMGSYSRRN